MSASASDALHLHYKNLQENFDITESGDYDDLVTPTGNGDTPVHRWFHMKEAFSARLLETVLEDLSLSPRGLSCLDPFSGSGTTAISLAELTAEDAGASARYFGVEVNPFLHLLASTKLRALQAPPRRFDLLAGRVAKLALGLDAPDAPALSTFSNDEYFQSESVDDIMRLVAASKMVEAEADPIALDLVRLAIGSVVEASSFLRRDGRTLRVVQGKVPVRPIQAFCEAVHVIVDDLPRRPSRVTGHVVHGDARRKTAIRAEGDLALFSPPYPNNIDYSEVYKLEAWALGLVADHDDFTRLRHRTLRSHGSLRWGSSDSDGSCQELAEPILAAICDDQYRQSREEVVIGYLEDMLAVMRNLRVRLRPGGHMVCVVGNSLHGRHPDQYVIASDLLLAELATRCGFQVTKIEVARYPKRRRSESEFLRESLIFATVPHG